MKTARASAERRGTTGQTERSQGYTLIEVMVALTIIAVTFGAIIQSYISATRKAEWSAFSFTAQSLAMQGLEQARSAKWDPANSRPVDELGVTNFTQVETLDVPASGPPVYATNYISITSVSTVPQMREIRADCVWWLKAGAGSRGPFTNTAVTLRAPDQ